MAYILKQKTSQGTINLYYAASHRIEGKKYPIQKRKYLGQLDTKSGEILKNRKLSCFSSEELKVLKKAGIVFNGREIRTHGRTPKREKKIP